MKCIFLCLITFSSSLALAMNSELSKGFTDTLSYIVNTSEQAEVRVQPASVLDITKGIQSLNCESIAKEQATDYLVESILKLNRVWVSDSEYEKLQSFLSRDGKFRGILFCRVTEQPQLPGITSSETVLITDPNFEAPFTLLLNWF